LRQALSTYGQTLDTQLEQLRTAGCSSRNIYREKVTDARADRRELLRMLDRLVPGGVFRTRFWRSGATMVTMLLTILCSSRLPEASDL
jgi:hypothetical protein